MEPIKELFNIINNARDAINAINEGNLQDAKTICEQINYDSNLVKNHLDATIHITH